jgi:cytochrome c5
LRLRLYWHWSLSLPVSAPGENAYEVVFKAVCVACRAADGTGSAMGKQSGAHSFQTAEVQKVSDAELLDIITRGKNRMPAYGSL